MAYGLNEEFERVSVYLAVTSKAFWQRVAHRMDPDEVALPMSKNVLKLCREVAHDHGWPTSETLIQRACLWMSEGKLPEVEVLAISEFLEIAPGPGWDPERVIVELVEPVRRHWQQQIAQKVVERYKNCAPFGSLLEEMAAHDRLGEAVADVEVRGTEVGEDTEELMERSPIGIHMPFGIAEVDSLLKGGPHLGTVVTLLGDSKSGKCHEKGQGILLFNGRIRKVENIKVGDKLMGPDGFPKRVLSTNQGRGELVTIRPDRGKSWRVNLDHILTIRLVKKNGGCPWDWRTVDVSVREWLTWPAHKRRNSYLFHAEPMEFGGVKTAPLLDPYFMGVYLGDGTTRQTTVSAGITTMDKEIVAELYKLATLLGLRIRIANKERTAPTYNIVGAVGSRKANVITAALRTYGLHRLGSGEKFIPDAYKLGSVETRLEILAGLMDTDGSLSRRAYDYISKSSRLAEDVAFVARSLGLSAYVKPCRKGCQTGAVGTYYRVTICGPTWKVPVRVERKKAPTTHHGGDRGRVAFTVEPSREDDYYGFTLDGDGRYCLDDFTVTHNSISLTFASAVAAMHGENVGYLALEGDDATHHARIMAAIVGVPINDLQIPSIRKDVLHVWKKMRAEGRVGRIIVNTFEPGSLTTTDVRAWFKAKEREKNIRIRFRVVDYGDLVAADGRVQQESKYSHGEAVWRMLVGMAQGEDGPEGKLPNWVYTASQAKRPEWKHGQPIPLLTRASTADSVHKYRLSDFFITLTPQPDMSASAGYLWYIDADRHYGQTGQVVGPVPHMRHMGRMADISHLG